jgi:hypothetical protein
MTDAVAEVVDQEAELESGFNSAMGIAPPETDAEEFAPVVEAPAVEEPVEETVTLNQSEVKQLLSRLDELDKHGKGLDKAFGYIGNLSETIEKLKSSASTGPLELSDEDLAPISAEYPELGGSIKQVLSNVLGRVRGGGQQVAPDFAPIRAEFQQQLVARDRAGEAKLLSVIEPNWKTETATDQFRVWMETQPDEYRQKIGDSWDALEISDAIKSFRTATTAKVGVPGQDRSKRLEAAITPKGTASNPGTVLTPEQEMELGFKRAARRA